MSQYTKYDKNPLYEKSLRNIKYLPYDETNNIDDKLVDFFNTMIVRRDTNYYEMSRSKSNYPMENSDILNSVRNELNDYVRLYNDWTNTLDKIMLINKDSRYSEYRYMVNHYTIPEIIRLNKLIYLYNSISNDVKPQNNKNNINRIILLIGLIIFIIILLLFIDGISYKRYYTNNN